MSSRMVCVPSENSLERINFSFASSNQLEIVSGLRMGTSDLFVQFFYTSMADPCRPCA